MTLARLPRGVVALGFVSLFMDLSSEMIHSLLPLFLVSVLGASALSVGLIEGIAEATAALAKLVSGMWSDRIGRRKPLLLLGYGMAALTKPLFPLASGVGAVLLARFLDRIGKGLRGAPRDALLADITPPALRGAAYGLRQALDTTGAILGPLVALALMAATGDDFRMVFWIATLPALVCVALILVAVDEPEATRPPVQAGARFARSELRRLSGHFWWVVGCASVLTLARFSEAFLLLRAEHLGLAATWVPGVLIVMNLFYAASAYPFGRLADNGGRHRLLAAGIALLVVADLVLAAADGIVWSFVGAAIWGLHMGATQGLLSAWVADTVPADLRGTGFGVFNLATGVTLLAASLIAGGLWTWLGPAMTFVAGALFASLALLGLVLGFAAGRGVPMDG
ncbi:MAG: MFS transporter [Rhodocyclaceae bacterium]|nr:MFS transporter [Rhodocyclaceae bacterium]